MPTLEEQRTESQMPRTLVAVRHGESLGNLAAAQEKAGDESVFSEDYRDTPSSMWGLTRLGFAQAQAAGVWIDRFCVNTPLVPSEFDKAYISPHIRSRQTFGGIALHTAVRGNGPVLDARLDLRLREQDFGDIATMPRTEYFNRYPDNARTRRTDRVYWRPPGGESVADVTDRVRLFLGALSRTHKRGTESVLLVTHGRQMSAVQIVLEGLDPHRWVDYLATNEIKNGQVVQHSRINPFTFEETPTYRWTRSVCPWENPDDPGVWREFTAPKRLTLEECLDGIPPEWRLDAPAGSTEP